MKKVFFFLVLLIGTAVTAQGVPVVENEVYNVAGLQVKPEYPGGMKAFYQYVSKSFRVPEVDSEEDIIARIFVTFVVEKDGSLTDIKAIRDPGYGLGNEAVRVLKLSAKWTPGMQNGKAVRTAYSLPVTINIEGTPKQKEQAKEPEEPESEKDTKEVKEKPVVKKEVQKRKKTIAKKKKS